MIWEIVPSLFLVGMSLLRSGAFQYLLEVNFQFFYLRSKNSGGTGTLPNVNIAKHMYTVFRQEILKWRVNHMLSSLYVIAPSPLLSNLAYKIFRYPKRMPKNLSSLRIHPCRWCKSQGQFVHCWKILLLIYLIHWSSRSLFYNFF